MSEYGFERAIKLGLKNIKENNPERRPKIGTLVLGTALVVPDYIKSTEWLMNRSYDQRHSKDEELLELTREMADRVHAQIICTAFEEMESYLRKIGAQAHFLLRNPKTIHAAKIRFRKGEFHKCYPAEQQARDGVKENTLQYFHEYMERMYRGGYASFLRELENLPSIKNSQNNAEWLCVSVEFYKAVEFLRHRTIHCNGRYDVNDLRRRLKPREQGIVKEITRRSKLFNADLMLPTKDASNGVIASFAGLAHLLYHCLSTDFWMTPEWPPEPEGD